MTGWPSEPYLGGGGLAVRLTQRCCSVPLGREGLPVGGLSGGGVRGVTHQLVGEHL